MSFNVNGSVGVDDRPDGEFGLRGQDFSTIGFGVDYSPSDAFNMGVSYLYETFASLETSRTANPRARPELLDPRRDWSDDIDENVHTYNAYFEAPKLAGKIDFGVNYDYTRARDVVVLQRADPTRSPRRVQLELTVVPAPTGTQPRLTTTYWLRAPGTQPLTTAADNFTVNDWALASRR